MDMDPDPEGQVNYESTSSGSATLSKYRLSVQIISVKGLSGREY
jgi:hypothetical protein